MSFRIIDYFFDKFLYAITESEPYVLGNALNNMHKYDSKIDIKSMTALEIEALDLK